MKYHFHIHSASLTDVGCKRKKNEDAIVCRQDAGLYCVADGMGGGFAGELASGEIAKAMEGLADELVSKSPGDSTPARIKSLLQKVHGELREKAEVAQVTSFGSTAVVLHTDRVCGEATLIHAGDSRIYRSRRGKLEQLTEDHSEIAEIRKNKSADLPENLNLSFFEGKLTNAIGLKPELRLDQSTHRLSADDLYLLCSDGLTTHFEDEELQERLRGASLSALDEVAGKLIEETKRRGARDNVSVLLVGVAEDPAVTAARRKRRMVVAAAMAAAVSVAVVLAVGVKQWRRAIAVKEQRSAIEKLLEQPVTISGRELDVQNAIHRKLVRAYTSIGHEFTPLLQQRKEEFAAEYLGRSRELILGRNWEALAQLPAFDPSMVSSLNGPEDAESFEAFLKGRDQLSDLWWRLKLVAENRDLEQIPELAGKFWRIVGSIAPQHPTRALAELDLSGKTQAEKARAILAVWPEDTDVPFIRKLRPVANEPEASVMLASLRRHIEQSRRNVFSDAPEILDLAEKLSTVDGEAQESDSLIAGYLDLYEANFRKEVTAALTDGDWKTVAQRLDNEKRVLERVFPQESDIIRCATSWTRLYNELANPTKAGDRMTALRELQQLLGDVPGLFEAYPELAGKAFAPSGNPVVGTRKVQEYLARAAQLLPVLWESNHVTPPHPEADDAFLVDYATGKVIKGGADTSGEQHKDLSTVSKSMPSPLRVLKKQNDIVWPVFENRFAVVQAAADALRHLPGHGLQADRREALCEAALSRARKQVQESIHNDFRDGREIRSTLKQLADFQHITGQVNELLELYDERFREYLDRRVRDAWATGQWDKIMQAVEQYPGVPGSSENVRIIRGWYAFYEQFKNGSALPREYAEARAVLLDVKDNPLCTGEGMLELLTEDVSGGAEEGCKNLAQMYRGWPVALEQWSRRTEANLEIIPAGEYQRLMIQLGRKDKVASAGEKSTRKARAALNALANSTAPIKSSSIVPPLPGDLASTMKKQYALLLSAQEGTQAFLDTLRKATVSARNRFYGSRLELTDGQLDVLEDVTRALTDAGKTGFLSLEQAQSLRAGFKEEFLQD